MSDADNAMAVLRQLSQIPLSKDVSDLQVVVMAFEELTEARSELRAAKRIIEHYENFYGVWLTGFSQEPDLKAR